MDNALRYKWISIALPIVAMFGCAPEQSGKKETATQASRPVPASTSPRLHDVARESGIKFVHRTCATGEFYFPEITGSGCALLDYDNDGDLDVYLLQGAPLQSPANTAATAPDPDAPTPLRNRLFRNERIRADGSVGPLRFTDVTIESGAGDTGYAMGVATGDIDNDGDVDIYITNFGPDVLLLNNGDGTFRDATAAFGLGDNRWTTSAAFLDYDRDGWLDLFVCGYADYSLDTHKPCRNRAGVRDYCAPGAYDAIPDVLYRNVGGKRFDVSTAIRLDDVAPGHALGIGIGDFDANGWPDILVANDGDPNHLWLNKDGELAEAALQCGAAVNDVGAKEAGMGVVVFDPDDDGDPDILLSHLNGETHTLYVNDGGAFTDRTARAQLAASSFPYTGFGVGPVDLDHDGDLDLFLANGDVRFINAAAESGRTPYDQPNQVFLNDGHAVFSDASAEFGRDVTQYATSRGLALGDIDNDGDIDLLVTNSNGPAQLLLNETPVPGSHSLLLRILDAKHHRDAYGATVIARLSDGRTLTRWVQTCVGYASASDPRVHLAWPATVRIKHLGIRSIDGTLIDVDPASVGPAGTLEIALP